MLFTWLVGCLIFADNGLAGRVYAKRSIDIHDAAFVCRNNQNVKSRGVYERTTITISSTDELVRSSPLQTQDVTSSVITASTASTLSTVNEGYEQTSTIPRSTQELGNSSPLITQNVTTTVSTTDELVRSSPANTQDVALSHVTTTIASTLSAVNEAITCSYENLPMVTDGFFDTSLCSGNLIGDLCNITCNHNYYTTNSSIVCELSHDGSEQSGVWSGGTFTCQAITCPYATLPIVRDGFSNKSSCSGNHIGDVCNITCNKNYYTTNRTKVCELSQDEHIGVWSGDNITCQIMTCSYSDLPNIDNGFFNVSLCSGNVIGDVCNGTCNDGYHEYYGIQSLCENNGGAASWSSVSRSSICYKPSCLASDLPNVIHGAFHWCLEAMPSYDVGTVCNLTCDYGYFPEHLRTIQCEMKSSYTASWSSVERVKCEEVTCPFSSLPEIPNGYYNTSLCTGNLVGDICPAICAEGYYPLLDTPMQYTCEVNEGVGSWKNLEQSFWFYPKCSEPQCSFADIPDVPHGEFKGCGWSATKIGTTCNLTCDYGFMPGEIKEVTCTDKSMYQAEWLPSDGLNCTAVKCDPGDLPSVLNGFFNGSSCPDHVGDRCIMTCNEGYYPVTESETECRLIQGETLGSWSDQISYSCEEIICSFDDLPVVVNGSFHESGCTGFGVSDTCRMTCDDGLIPNFVDQTQCAIEGSTGYWLAPNSFECKDPWNETLSACLESEDFDTFNETGSLMECKKLCMDKTESSKTCLSINFNSVLRLCRLNFNNQHTVVSSSSFQEPCSDEGWKYAERIDIGLWTTPILACSSGMTLLTAIIKDHPTCQLLCSQTTGCCSSHFSEGQGTCSLFPNQDEYVQFLGCNYLYSQRVDKNCMETMTPS